MDTLTRMRAFVAVAEAGGFSAAGRKIGRSKALLSKYVRELEDEVGALLLNRTTRQLSLTPAGEVYLARGGELIREVDGLADLVRDQATGAGGTVRLSAPRTFADSPLGEALVSFALARPDVRLDIDLSDRFVDLVEEGFDMAIRITAPTDSSLIAKRLAPMSLVTVASPALIERVGAPFEPADMARLPVIVDTNAREPHRLRYRGRQSPGGGFGAGGEIGADVSVAIPEDAPLTANSPVMSLRAARAGIGFAVLPDFVAECALEDGSVVEVLRPYRWDAAVIQALYPHRRHVTTRVRALLDHLGEWFKARR